MKTHQTRIILAGMTGNLVETFDMAICGMLSVYLAKYLFNDTGTGLFIVFITFFAGYMARPIGAMVLGLLSDAYGRKLTLAGSILSMGISTTLIGFIPPGSVLGIFSVFVLLLLRIIQSFSCGAEYLNSSVYLIENADESSRGFSGSWASFGCMAGLLVASLVALAVNWLVTVYPDMEWLIWRLPFVLALLGSSIGLYIRLFIPESLEYVLYYANHPRPKPGNIFKQSLSHIKASKFKSLYVFLLSGLGVTVTFLIYILGPTQAHIYGSFTDYQIIVSNIVSLLVLLCVFPIVGSLSDRIDREKIVLAACIGLLILAEPFFYMLAYGSYASFMLMHALISIPAAAYYAIVPVMLAEIFPINLRCTALSLLYSVAASLSAGLTPVLSLMLLRHTHSAVSPALLLIGWIVLSLSVIRVRYIRERKTGMVFQ